MMTLKEILAMSKDQRQTLQELMGYATANEMGLQLFTPQQKALISERMIKNCSKKDAMFKYEDVKREVLDKLK